MRHACTHVLKSLKSKQNAGNLGSPTTGVASLVGGGDEQGIPALLWYADEGAPRRAAAPLAVEAA